jgi:uncharacterized membrane protein
MQSARSLIIRILFFQSLIGCIIAMYVVQSFVRDAPIYCVTSGCEVVRRHPSSYLLGIPVPSYGLIGYTTILLLLLAYAQTSKPKLLTLAKYITLGGTAFVAWFTYTEAFIIRGFCMWCLVSAFNMVVMLLLFILLHKRFSCDTSIKDA